MTLLVNRPNRAPARGLTLLECVLSVVIVSTLFVAALGATGAAAKARLVQKDHSNGLALARDLLSEIVQRAYVDPNGGTGLGPNSGETRATFNDVDDYDGLTDSPPHDQSGNVITGYTGWARNVRVEYIDQSLLGTILGADSGLKRITVTVTAPGGTTTTLRGLRSSSSPYEKAALHQQAYVSRSVVTLQVGTQSTGKVVSAVNPLNQVP